MGISNTFCNKLLRYPNLFSSLFSLSSYPQPLNPTSLKSLFHPNQLHNNSFFHFSSNGLPSDFSMTPPFAQSRYSFAIYRYPIRWFSVSSNSPENGEISKFEDVDVACFDESSNGFEAKSSGNDENSWFENVGIGCFDESSKGFESNLIGNDKNSGFENVGIGCFDESSKGFESNLIGHDKNSGFENLGIGCFDETNKGFKSNLIGNDKNSGFENVGIGCFDESNEGFESNLMGNDKSNESNEGFGSKVTPKEVSEIIEVVRSGESDLVSKLDLMRLSVCVESINEIFRILNCERISALDFFQWVLSTNPEMYANYDVCSLIIDNCGWLDDYETMVSMLKEFRSKRICLTEKAFGFLPVLGSSKDSIMESIRRITGALNEVGGSCQGSGICALIKMLCTLDSFELAKFVIEITERKVSYYNILIRERCKRCHIEEANDLLKEMREFGCDPKAKTYNYVLACLCKIGRVSEARKLLEEMVENGSHPDEVTFEIFIYYSCRLGKIDAANQFLDQMVYKGLEPRHSTHAAFVKGYFDSRQYGEAYNYVCGLSPTFVHSSNVIYSLLAGLHQKKGHLFVAHSILIEMMEKGLKPNFPVYVKIMKQLVKIGKGHLAGKLKSRFSRFLIESSKTAA